MLLRTVGSADSHAYIAALPVYVSVVCDTLEGWVVSGVYVHTVFSCGKRLLWWPHVITSARSLIE